MRRNIPAGDEDLIGIHDLGHCDGLVASPLLDNLWGLGDDNEVLGGVNTLVVHYRMLEIVSSNKEYLAGIHLWSVFPGPSYLRLCI